MNTETRRAVGFDLDGVLIVNPFDSCVVPRLERLLASAPKLAGLDAQEVSQRVRGAIRSGWQRRMATEDLASAYDWDAIYLEAAVEFGLPSVASSGINVSGWVEECCAAGGHIRALPGAAELLERLAIAGSRLVVISNGYAPYQEPVLRALGLFDFFDAVVTPDRVGYAKPDRRIFEAAGHLDVFVGDTLLHDILGARQAGIEAVWVNPALPADLAVQTPRQRAASPQLEALVRTSLAATPFASFHPEADAKSCLPAAVVTGMSEVADVVLASGAAATAQR